MVVFAVFQENVAVGFFADWLIVCGGYFRDSSFLVNKRVLAEEEQTVATLLEKSANLEEPEQREVDFSLS
jgi:hypothetical protein